GGGAQREEEQGEAEHEERGVHRGLSPGVGARAVLQLLERQARDEAHVAGHDREDAGRQERHQPRQEGQRERYGSGFHHRPPPASRVPADSSRSRFTARRSVGSAKSPVTSWRTRPSRSIRNEVGSVRTPPKSRTISAVAMATGKVMSRLSRNSRTS